MGVKTKITDKGVISTRTTGGSGTNSGYGPFKLTQGTVSSDKTFVVGEAGAHILSGNNVITGTLPSAASAPGSYWVFRAASVHAHNLSGSGGDQTPFCDQTSQGEVLKVAAAVGSSVALMSDGTNWLVLGASGTLTFAAAP